MAGYFAMADYCCYFLDDGDHVTGVESLPEQLAERDAAALAYQILRERGCCNAVEVWDGDRFVVKRSRDRSSQPTTSQTRAV